MSSLYPTENHISPNYLFFIFQSIKRSTIYILTLITLEILLIFILIYWILSPIASVILGFGFFHLLYSDLPSGIWVAPSMFVFLVSPYIILIGCLLGLALCSLKEDL